MALLNIGASNRDDAFYRYKMPRLVTKIEGRGNGIKTNLVNMVDVAKALARPPAYTTKFFGCELGAQSKFDEKTATAIVNGAHETAKLAALLEIFIKKYVQCYGCKNPETEVLVTKTQTIILKCAACGYISDVDMRDKLTTFILKNPPEQKRSGKEKKAMRRAEKERMKEGELADEENKKAKKEAIKKKKGHEDEKKPLKKKHSGSEEDEETSPLGSQADEEDESDDVEWQTDTSVAAAQQRIKEQLTTATTEMVMLSVDDDDVVDSPRSASFKEKTGKAKLKKSESGGRHEANGHAKDDDGTEQELSIQESLLKEFKDEILKGSTPSQMALIIESKKCDQQDVLVLYVQALFGGISKGLSKEVLKRKAYLAAVVNDASAQDRLLVAFETYFASCPDIGKEVAIVLKVLYDEDIIEEESILEWFGRQPSLDLKADFVRKEARPFIDWLQNAEAESEEEDE